jgi:hypothetical protein
VWDMRYMFMGAKAFAQDITRRPTTALARSDYMFDYADAWQRAFKRDLGADGGAGDGPPEVWTRR